MSKEKTSTTSNSDGAQCPVQLIDKTTCLAPFDGKGCGTQSLLPVGPGPTYISGVYLNLGFLPWGSAVGSGPLRLMKPLILALVGGKDLR